MFTSFLIVAAAIKLASCAVSPLTPTAATAGTEIKIQWGADTTGTWTDTSCWLMSGSNWDMVPVAQIFDNVDGTTVTEYDWTVPEVAPYSAIYFLQFTNNGQDPTWSTRFAITSPSGQTTPPQSSIQPDGQTIGWGNGALEGQPTSAASGAAAPSGSSSPVSSAVSSSASDSSASASSSASGPTSSASSSGMSRMSSSARSGSSSASPSVVNDASATSDAQQHQIVSMAVLAVLGSIVVGAALL